MFFFLLFFFVLLMHLKNLFVLLQVVTCLSLFLVQVVTCLSPLLMLFDDPCS